MNANSVSWRLKVNGLARDHVFHSICQVSLLDRGVRLELDDKSPVDRQGSGLVCGGTMAYFSGGRGGDVDDPGSETEA